MQIVGILKAHTHPCRKDKAVVRPVILFLSCLYLFPSIYNLTGT